MKVVIDRFEGDYAVVEIEEGLFVNLPRALVPDGREGDIVLIQILKEEGESKKKDLNKRLKRLFKE